VAAVPTEILACPACGSPLEADSGRVVCAGCGRAYTQRDATVDLRVERGPSEEHAPSLLGRSLARIVSLPAVYDVVQRAAGARPILARLRSALAPAAGRTVLDVGGGTGTLETVLPAGARYVWLDPDDRKLAGFRAKSQSLAILGDATRIPLRDDSVDWCVSVAVSHHLDDEAFGAMLSEIRRVTRDRFVFLDAVVTPRLRSRFLWHYDRGRHPRTAEALRRELAARFEIASATEFSVHHRYLLVDAR
jgi:SAM-dependent methyltransferase